MLSSNINEVYIAILDSFIQKFHEQKKHKTLTSEQKLKMLLKTSKRKIVTYSLICVLCFCLSVFVSFSAFVPFSAFNAFGAFSACEIFS